MTYITTKVKFEVLEKKLHRLFKKIESCGETYKFQVVREFQRLVPVYATDDISYTKTKVDEVLVECVEFELEFDPYIVGNYTVGAVVKRTLDDCANLVYPVDPESSDFSEYRTAQLMCQHCNINRRRNKVVILVDVETGAHKMVGRACLHDYTGYDVESFVNYFQDIQELVLGQDEGVWIKDTDLPLYPNLISTRAYLAYCIQIVASDGYNKSVKEDALRNLKNHRSIDDRYYTLADEVIGFFTELKEEETATSFEWDVKQWVTNMPIKYANGFIAYAYTLMLKIQERRKRLEDREKEKEISQHVGSPKQKLTITGTLTVCGGYETQFDYIRIFKIVDDNGNVFIWKTATIIEQTFERDGHHDMVVLDKPIRVEIAGTVKEHGEYRGEKQTVLTRCKVIRFITD